MDSIDVSIGLGPTLQLLARYHQSGVLQAKMSHLPILRGRGVGVIEVIGGKMISCFVRNEKGEQYSLPSDILRHFDESRGPFEWRFHMQKPQKSVPTPPVAPKQTTPLFAHPLAGHNIPQAVTNLDVDTLTSLTPQQKRALRMTYAMINGRRTLADIEAHAPLPTGAVYESIVALISMRVIIIHFQ